MMSTEKIIKNQAKKSLAGNWSSLIAAIMFVLVMLIAVDGLISLLACAFNLVDMDTGEVIESKEFLFYVITTVVYVGLFFLSPIVNGVLRMFSSVALQGKCKISDVFFYFKSGAAYFKTLMLNLILAALYAILGFGLDFYKYATMITGKSLQDGLEFDILTFVLIATMIVSIVFKICIYLIFIHYPLIAYATFDNISVAKCVVGLWGFSTRHLGSTIKLLFSFVGWILLCFFVVPAFYVLPYLIESVSISAKWLFSLDKDRGLLC
jgi:hypothetical protein